MQIKTLTYQQQAFNTFQLVSKADSVSLKFAGLTVISLIGLFFVCITVSAELCEIEKKKLLSNFKRNSLVSFEFSLSSILFISFLKINHLMIQIIDQPIEIKIFGIFALNNNFLYEIFALTISYFIVMLQYELEV